MYKIKKTLKLALICLITGCATLGPVKTELRDAYPKIEDPIKFQSPIEAIELLEKDLSNHRSSQNKNTAYVSYQESVLRILKNDQSFLEKKLENENHS